MRKKRERKIFGVKFTPDFLNIILKKGKVEITRTPIPDDAEYLSTHYNYGTDTFIAYFYHPSFELTLDGGLLPQSQSYSLEYRRIK